MILRSALVALSITFTAVAQQATPISAQSGSGRPTLDVAPHEQFAPYWTAEPGWRTELQLRNNLAQGDLTVTPVLRSANGDEYPLPPVTIAPNEIKSVDVSDAVTKSAPQLKGLFGSVVFRYSSSGMRNLYAAVMVYDTGHPIAFHMDAFTQATDYDSGSREGIWWLPSATATDYLVLTNKSWQALQAKLSLFDASGKSSVQQIVLQPKTTLRNSVRTLIQKAGLTGSYGGFKIDVPSKVGSLDTAYLLFDEIVGFSALMKTFDRNPQGKIEQRLRFPEVKTWTTRAPMLALANPDPGLGFPAGTALQPEVFVRNATAAPTAVSVRFNWRSDTKGGSAIGPTLQLAPYETRLVDVGALQKSGTIPAQARWASVELSSSGRPNDIMATAASYDSTLRYGTQTPFNDQLTFHWEGGEWRVDATHNSIITAGNGGSAASKALFTIYYDGGKKRYDLEQELKPHEQMWVDVGKLIRDQVPDKNGLLLPPDLMMGSYELQDLTDRGVGNLYEGKVIVDKTFGHVAYGCATCCGYNASPWMYYDPIGVGIDYGSTQDVWDRNNCTSQDTSVLEYILDSSWDTGNHAIATASNAVITGVAVGSTTNSATGTLTIGNINSLRCPQEPLNPSGPVNVPPTISQSQNLWYFGNGVPAPTGFSLGGTSATLTASGGGEGTYTWSITAGGSIAALQGTTSGQNVTSVTIASTSYSTSANDVTAQVQYTPSGGSATTATHILTVDSPYKLLSGAVTNAGVTGNTCTNPPAGNSGFQSEVNYTILSFLGAQIANVGINENFGDSADDYVGNNWPNFVAGGITTPTGQFYDNICVIFPSGTPPSLPPQSPLSAVKIDHVSQTWFVGSATPAAGVEVQSDTLQRYQDHGLHLSIISPVR